tara:strand:+ start:146 stop:376 length:231 start_codon:yes stop_codon:yes gene_type:complete
MFWLDDPGRFVRPKEITTELEEAFFILAQLDEYLELYYNKFYSKKLKDQYLNKVNKLKQRVTKEVFELMEIKYSNN